MKPDQGSVMRRKRPDGPGATRTVRCCCTAKPSSVIGLETNPTRDHFSCPAVTRRLQHATRLQTCGPQASGRDRKEAACACTRWGLPCPVRHRPGGALLPHRCTLTGASSGGLFSVALSLTRSGSVGVTHHLVLSCSDFPPGRFPAERPHQCAPIVLRGAGRALRRVAWAPWERFPAPKCRLGTAEAP